MLFCIGGVCVPYTAVVPILILSFKWVAGKLAQMRLLPEFLQKWLQLPNNPNASSVMDSSPTVEKQTPMSSGPSVVKVLESDEEFQTILKQSEKVICKFTATWCGPCKAIQPFFEQCSSNYSDKNYKFLTIDVDDFDDIASTYNIAMMPTFVILTTKPSVTVVGKYSGSNQHQLQTFLKEHLEQQ